MTATETSLSKAQLMTRLGRRFEKYKKLQAEAKAMRPELDAMIQDALAAGATYRDVAAVCGRSLAWVQGSVARSKGET